MKSHQCEFSGKELAGAILPALLPVILFALAMRFGVSARLWPAPQPALDTDRTILLHQAAASQKPQNASVILIGDSSCLMDVSAPQLTRLLPAGSSALNLGTLSYLDLNAFAGLLRRAAAANSNQLRAVVLLMHPEALRRSSPVEQQAEALSRYFRGADHCGPATPPLLCGLGAEMFRARILSRVWPAPLAGAYGRRYGFSHDLWEHLSQQRGSLIDPGTFNAKTASGSAEYRLAKTLETASGRFRAALPPGVKLFVGITPAPEGFAGLGHAAKHREMLETWGGWLGADRVLTNLPATLPDGLFASTTHLNEGGAALYTEALAKALAGEP